MRGGMPAQQNAARLNEERVVTDKITVMMEWNIPQKELIEKTIGHTAHTPPPAFLGKCIKMRWKKIIKNMGSSKRLVSSALRLEMEMRVYKFKIKKNISLYLVNG